MNVLVEWCRWTLKTQRQWIIVRSRICSLLTVVFFNPDADLLIPASSLNEIGDLLEMAVLQSHIVAAIVYAAVRPSVRERNI